jgi:hypothetical protein
VIFRVFVTVIYQRVSFSQPVDVRSLGFNPMGSRSKIAQVIQTFVSLSHRRVLEYWEAMVKHTGKPWYLHVFFIFTSEIRQ